MREARWKDQLSMGMQNSNERKGKKQIKPSPQHLRFLSLLQFFGAQQEALEVMKWLTRR